MTSVWIIRGILIALSVALATVLIVRGNVIIGVLIGALAVTRLVLLVQMRRRRDRFRRRLAERRIQR